MARLRAPDGCPWDKEQNHQSLKPYLIEEAYEVMEAIEAGDPAMLKEELGDLLLQVLFHCRLAEEKGHFDAQETARALAQKMIDRHPHVFEDALAETSGEVLRNLGDQQEKGPRGRREQLRIHSRRRARRHACPPARPKASGKGLARGLRLAGCGRSGGQGGRRVGGTQRGDA